MEGNPLVTWNPSPGDSNPPESPDSQISNGSNSLFQSSLHALAALNQKFRGSLSNSGQGDRRSFFPRFQRQQVNGRHVMTPRNSSSFHGQSKYPWWNSTGPRLETNKISGNTVLTPVVAPPTAPGEHKKMILDQTTKKLEHISADWPCKTDFLIERFSGVCANASNEADLRLLKLEDYTSDVYEFSSPVGLTLTMETTQIAGWHNLNLRYLQMELQIHPGKLATPSRPIPGLPSTRSIQVVLKLPTDPTNRDNIHPGCTRDILLNPSAFMNYLKASGLPVELGMINTRSNLFDLNLFERESKKLYHECLFYTIKEVLYREYVGDSIVHDTHTRLQRCKQGVMVNGKYVTKRIQDFHSEFMLIVHEYDPKKPIPCNLTQVEFHNLTKKFQDKLIANSYKPPQETGSAGEQYEHLTALKEEALKVEKELDQITDTVRSVSGVKRSSPTAPAFTANAYLSSADLSEFEDAVEFSSDEADNEDIEGTKLQNVFLSAHLSVAEQALRNASGERAPLQCWGCRSIPEYAKNSYHRFSDCPHQKDPRVQDNFRRELQAFSDKRRQDGAGKYSRYGPNNSGQPHRKQPPRAMLSPAETEGGWSDHHSLPGKELAAFVATTMANPSLEAGDRVRLANAFSASMSQKDEASETPAQGPTTTAMLTNTVNDSDGSRPFQVFMVQPVLRASNIMAPTNPTQLTNGPTASMPLLMCPEDWSSSWEQALSPVAVNDARDRFQWPVVSEVSGNKGLHAPNRGANVEPTVGLNILHDSGQRLLMIQRQPSTSSVTFGLDTPSDSGQLPIRDSTTTFTRNSSLPSKLHARIYI